MNKSVNRRRVTREVLRGQQFFGFCEEDVHYFVHSQELLDTLLNQRRPMLFTLFTRLNSYWVLRKKSLINKAALVRRVSVLPKETLDGMEKRRQDRWRRKHKS